MALIGAPPRPQNLLSLTALRKGPPAPPPVDVELALPKLSLLSPRAVPPPGPPSVTTTTEGGIPEKGRVAEGGVPKVGVPRVGVPPVPPGGAAVPVPSLDIAVPKVGVTLGLPGAADGTAETLGRKLPKLELLCPKVCGDFEGGPKMAALEVTAPPVALEVALGEKKGAGDKGGGKGTPSAALGGAQQPTHKPPADPYSSPFLINEPLALIAPFINPSTLITPPGYGGLSLSIEGPSKVDISTEELPDGTCRVGYCPTEPGNYIIAVQFGEQHVPGTAGNAYTGLYWVILGGTGRYWGYSGVYWGILGYIGGMGAVLPHRAGQLHHRRAVRRAARAWYCWDWLYWVVLGYTGRYWGVLGLYWVVLGCTGLYWEVLGCIVAILGCAGAYWVCIGAMLGYTGATGGLYWVILGPWGAILIYTGLYWSILRSTGAFWCILVCTQPDLCWSLLCYAGLYWSILVHTDPYWVVPVCTGVYSFIVLCTGSYWSILVLTGLPPPREPLLSEGDRGGPCEGEHHSAAPRPPRSPRGHSL